MKAAFADWPATTVTLEGFTLSASPDPMLIEHLVVLPAALESETTIEKMPAAVGVPVTAPVAVFSVRPAGSVPTME